MSGHEGPYDYARERDEARAAVDHLYTEEELKYGKGAPTKAEADADQDRDQRRG